MTRQNIVSETGQILGWFDPDRAKSWDEATTAGDARVSAIAGQWEHQRLYLTPGGRWILRCWSQRQDVEDTYAYVSAERARKWLLLCHHDDAVTKHFGALEFESVLESEAEPASGSGAGRPEIGGFIGVRLGDELLVQLNAYAQRAGVSRSEAVRTLLASVLGNA